MKLLPHVAAAALALAAAATSPFTSAATAQTAHPGWALSPAPSLSGSVRELSDGTFLQWNGSTLARIDSSGTVLTTYATFTPSVWTGAFGVAPDESFAIVGESSTGGMYRLDLPAGTLTHLTDIVNNTSLAIAPDARVFVSAAATTLVNNDLVLLDAMTGAQSTIGSVPGASGPIGFGPDGRLWYASVSNSFPSPLGSSTVYAWSADLVEAKGPLTTSNGFPWMTGLDGAASLAVDPESGRVFVAESRFEATYVCRIREVWPLPLPPLFSGPPGAWVSFSQLVTTPGPSVFAPYQPDAAARLRMSWNDFGGNSGVRHLTPARPVAAFSGAGTSGPGDVVFALSGGVPNGFALLTMGPSALVPASELPVWGFGLAPLLAGLDLGTMTILPGTFPLDASGGLGFGFSNPGGLEGWIAVQAIVLDEQFKLVGTSSVAPF